MNMKKKLLIGALAAGTIIGGAFAVNAANNDGPLFQSKSSVSVKESRDLVPMDEASRIALAAYGGYIEEIELDKDGNYMYYEVEMKTEQGEVELLIDAETGDILSVKEKKGKRKDHPISVSEYVNKYISMEEASKIALSTYNGYIKENELEKEEGFVYFEVKMKTDQGEIEFYIDAQTGEILSEKQKELKKSEVKQTAKRQDDIRDDIDDRDDDDWDDRDDTSVQNTNKKSTKSVSINHDDDDDKNETKNERKVKRVRDDDDDDDDDRDDD